MKLSVVIPTHNRAEILKTTLQRVLDQEGAEFEVIVVDDGSTDDTEVSSKSLEQESRARGIEFKYVQQPASHQGVARNRGVEAATGDVIVFIGDDIFVEPGFLKFHADRHAEHPDENVVVLGHTTWDPVLPINDVMRFLEDSGWQFGYKFLSPGFVQNPQPYKFFYTSNISLKKSFFQKEKFDENFKVYGWEDVELGYRLWKNHGMRLFYELGAKTLHHHFMDEAALEKRMFAVGQSAVVFEKIHPDAPIVPMGFKKTLLRLLTQPLAMSLLKMVGGDFYLKSKCWHDLFAGMGSNH